MIDINSKISVELMMLLRNNLLDLRLPVNVENSWTMFAMAWCNEPEAIINGLTQMASHCSSQGSDVTVYGLSFRHRRVVVTGSLDLPASGATAVAVGRLRAQCGATTIAKTNRWLAGS